MKQDIFNVQAALLYAEAPVMDAAALTTAIHKRAAWTGVACALEILPCATGDQVLTLGGGGVHVTISLQNAPCPPEVFAAALQAPIRKVKSFDFEGAIAEHSAAIVITIGDGDKPLPQEARQMSGGMSEADPIQKLMVLQLVMQSLIEEATPLMVDFCPSHSLLSPVEFDAVADMALPVPILFHPLLEVGGASQKDQPLLRMTAQQSQFLAEKELILDGAPADMNPGLMINILATLIIEHRSGGLEFEHGAVIDLGEGLAVQFIETKAEPEAPTGRIIARLTDPEGPFDTSPRAEITDAPIEHMADMLDATMDDLIQSKTQPPEPMPATSLPPVSAKPPRIPRLVVTAPLILACAAGYAMLSQGFAETLRSSFSAEMAGLDRPVAPAEKRLVPQYTSAAQPVPASRPVETPAEIPSVKASMIETNGLVGRLIRAEQDR